MSDLMAENALKDSLVKDIVVEYSDEDDIVLSSSHVQLGTSGFSYEYDVIASNHSPEAAELFRWFRSIHSSCDLSNGEEMVREMLRMFREHKSVFSSLLREYVLIEGIVELCHRLQIKNSHLVREVLDVIYETWSSFGPLHFTVIFKPGIFRSIHKDAETDAKFRGVLSFYLEHARRMKLEYNGRRMIDMSVYSTASKSPVFAAADAWCWRSLLKYLQYGARFEDVVVSPATTRHGVNLAMIDTLRSFLCHLGYVLVQPVTALNTESDVEDFFMSLYFDIEKLIKTFSIILRAVRFIQKKLLHFPMTVDVDQNWRILEVSSHRVLCNEVVDVLLPNLKARYGRVPELKHSCRWVIRERLNENWQLPHGIEDLPLPKQMKRYLNLLLD